VFAPLLAERDGAALGYVFCQAAYDSGFALRGLYVADLFVRLQARRQGVGRALLGAAARLAKVSGGGYLWLTTLPWNTSAHAFYRSLATIEESVIAFAIAGPDLDRLAAS
jgi:GNAT superfamily N-acetyltransferase